MHFYFERLINLRYQIPEKPNCRRGICGHFIRAFAFVSLLESIAAPARQIIYDELIWVMFNRKQGIAE